MNIHINCINTNGNIDLDTEINFEDHLEDCISIFLKREKPYQLLIQNLNSFKVESKILDEQTGFSASNYVKKGFNENNILIFEMGHPRTHPKFGQPFSNLTISILDDICYEFIF